MEAAAELRAYDAAARRALNSVVCKSTTVPKTCGAGEGGKKRAVSQRGGDIRGIIGKIERMPTSNSSASGGSVTDMAHPLELARGWRFISRCIFFSPSFFRGWGNRCFSKYVDETVPGVNLLLEEFFTRTHL